MKRCDGFTLVEALFAMAILGVALASILPSFLTFLDTNSLSEERSDAVAAAQLVMEELRERDPASLPTSGSSAVRLVPVGSREFEVVTIFCADSSLCAAARRHVSVEVTFGGRVIYDVSSVFARVR